jgi:hypothetical protein
MELTQVAGCGKALQVPWLLFLVAVAAVKILVS